MTDWLPINFTGAIDYIVQQVQNAVGSIQNFILDIFTENTSGLMSVVLTVLNAVLSPLSIFFSYSMQIYAFLSVLIPALFTMLYFAVTNFYNLAYIVEDIILAVGISTATFEGKNQWMFYAHKQALLFIVNIPTYMVLLTRGFMEGLRTLTEVLTLIYQFVRDIVLQIIALVKNVVPHFPE